MALSRVKVWSAGEILYALDLNSEFNNVLNNALSLISPLTASLNAGGFKISNYGGTDAPTSVTDAALNAFVQSGTGATTRTLQAKLRDWVSVKDFGATADGVTDDLTAIHAARDALTNGGELYFPAGTYNIGSGATGLVIAGTTTKSYRLVGDGPRSIIKYTGTGDAVKFDNSAGTSILQSMSGFKIDLTGANAAANGLHISGVWRSEFEKLYITRDSAAATGAGVLADDATNGTFDVRYRDLYINNFGRGMKLVGGGTNKVTNTRVDGAYISSNTINIEITNAVDFLATGVQSELASSDGVKLTTVDNFEWQGGAIEGSGGYGINCVSAVAGGQVICLMANNTTANIGGSPTHFRTYFNNAEERYEGSLIRYRGIQAGAKAYLQFFENGSCDARFARSTNGNDKIGIFQGTTENARIDAASGVFEGNYANLEVTLRLKDGVSAPSTTGAYAQIYVDTADGDLKVKFGDGTVKTIVVDT